MPSQSVIVVWTAAPARLQYKQFQVPRFFTSSHLHPRRATMTTVTCFEAFFCSWLHCWKHLPFPMHSCPSLQFFEPDAQLYTMSSHHRQRWSIAFPFDLSILSHMSTCSHPSGRLLQQARFSLSPSLFPIAISFTCVNPFILCHHDLSRYQFER